VSSRFNRLPLDGLPSNDAIRLSCHCWLTDLVVNSGTLPNPTRLPAPGSGPVREDPSSSRFEDGDQSILSSVGGYPCSGVATSGDAASGQPKETYTRTCTHTTPEISLEFRPYDATCPSDRDGASWGQAGFVQASLRRSPMRQIDEFLGI
jgi:hypothetical protein